MQYVAVGTINFSLSFPNVIMAVANEDNTIVRPSFIRFIILESFLQQISIGSQQVTLNALQVVTFASRNVTSGTIIAGSKPFAAYSGNICGDIFGQCETCDYVMVLCVTIFNFAFLKSNMENIYRQRCYRLPYGVLNIHWFRSCSLIQISIKSLRTQSEQS